MQTPCRDGSDPARGDLWFAEGTAKKEQAKQLCLQCPLRLQCLEVALQAQEPWGIWGGTDVAERRAILAARGRGLVIVEVAA